STGMRRATVLISATACSTRWTAGADLQPNERRRKRAANADVCALPFRIVPRVRVMSGEGRYSRSRPRSSRQTGAGSRRHRTSRSEREAARRRPARASVRASAPPRGEGGLGPPPASGRTRRPPPDDADRRGEERRPQRAGHRGGRADENLADLDELIRDEHARGSMNLTVLKDTPPWEWPAGTGKMLLDILRDDRAAESDLLLAAELAGGV